MQQNETPALYAVSLPEQSPPPNQCALVEQEGVLGFFQLFMYVLVTCCTSLQVDTVW